ncbi:restriction endonuclease subunit S [Candidatus Marinarcus aquaticus]|uniref:Type I restriction modification DNA specificity domain-containing protein n=1 Tax=Candidatus Marinarcus aquaticus TaxID=2044504 RepID=A0A4Q0XQX1_9BACT|nr:restriction endonuclease subunit S [Candidatus Marinarcus aquaticus]RXJ55433.1 hypothetical protein CRV04_10020 [Candidatus Marinarcus aquaticus]
MSNGLPQGWKEKQLSLFIDIKHGYAFKGKDFSDNETKYILLTPGNFKILGGFKSDKFKYYSKNGYIPEEYILNQNDLLVTMTDLSKAGDTLGYPLLVPTLDNKVLLHNQRLGKIEFLNDDLHKIFLYYIFCSNDYRGHVLGSATGTTVRHTAPNRIMNFQIKYPSDINEQKRIADILSGFDDKIETNNQINQTLEEMASTLFKEWFENFNFPNNQGKPYKDSGGEMKPSELGKIPIDWEVKKLEKIVSMKYGKMPNKKDLVSKGYPVYSGYKISGFHKEYLYENSELIIVARGVGGTGDVKFSPKKSWITNLSIVLPLDEEEIKYYLFYVLTRKKLRYLDSGSAQSQITISDLNMLKIIFPKKEILDNYYTLSKPIFEQIQQNQQQNKILKQQRDSLLPKLISGEIRV